MNLWITWDFEYPAVYLQQREIFKSAYISNKNQLSGALIFCRYCKLIPTSNKSNLLRWKSIIRRPMALRYTNYIPMERCNSGNLNFLILVLKTLFFWFQFDRHFPDTIGYMYPKSICMNCVETDSWTFGKLSGSGSKLHGRFPLHLPVFMHRSSKLLHCDTNILSLLIILSFILTITTLLT